MRRIGAPGINGSVRFAAQPHVHTCHHHRRPRAGRSRPAEGATWTAAIGRHQLTANHWALKRGHARTGLEDNVYFDKGRLAASNAELVKRVADLCGGYDRHPASPAEAPRLLGLRPQ